MKNLFFNTIINKEIEYEDPVTGTLEEYVDIDKVVCTKFGRAVRICATILFTALIVVTFLAII